MTFRDPRRRLAFVMVAHTGILLIGVGCLTARGVTGSAVYAVGDGTVKAALWTGLALLGLSRPADDELTTPDLSRSRRQVGLTVLTVGGLATAGLPLFATGLGKSAIEEAAAAAGYPWVTPIIVLTAALTGAAMLHIAWAWARDVPRSARSDVDGQQGSWMSVVGCGAALLGFSTSASLIGRWAAAAGARFVDTVGYQRRVLDGVGVLPARARALPSPLGWWNAPRSGRCRGRNHPRRRAHPRHPWQPSSTPPRLGLPGGRPPPPRRQHR